MMKHKVTLLTLTTTLWFGATLMSPAQVFKIQHTFTNAPDGANPLPLVWASGTFFGSTANGGTSGNGALFRFDTNGPVLTMIHNFTGATNDGALPNSLLAAGNVIYGTTIYSGTNNRGTIFSASTNSSVFTPLYSFGPAPDGYYPQAGLILSGGTLYGTATSGGTNNAGTVFKINTNGTGYAILHWFTNNPDGNAPQSELVLNGSMLFGTTLYGGAGNKGTVFAVNTNGGGFSILHSFTNAPDGYLPYGGLLLNAGVLYGMTSAGGSNLTGTIFALNPDGSGYTTLYHFSSTVNNRDGSSPKGTLTANDIYLYGSTHDGGAGNGGTLFQINTNGTGFTVIKSFTTNSASGQALDNGVIWVGNSLWGATYQGGTGGFGTLFSEQLSPMITAQPQSVSVTNSYPASFTVLAADDSPVTYQWYFNTNTFLAGQTNNQLNFTSVSNINAGTYTVAVADNFGATTSSPAVLTVVSTLPVIMSQPQNLIVTNGDPASFTVVATGQSPLKYQWYSNSVSTAIGTLLAGKTNSTYSFTSNTNSNGRYYSVVISNTLGKATSSPALLTVVTKPLIATNPQPITVSLGAPANFSVTALGLNLHFQWYSNSVSTAIGTRLTGQTNSTYSFTSITNSNGRYYAVVVTNTFGAVTSSPALLTVSSAAGQPKFLSFSFIPASSSFSLTLSNTASSANRLWASTNIASTNFWRVIASNVMAANGLWSFTDTNIASTNKARFYRASSP